jgi:hypothetical protein
MGVELAVYRARIGTFSRPFCVSRHAFSSGVGLVKKCEMSQVAVAVLFISLAIGLCGDVESNPGPSHGRECAACYVVDHSAPGIRYFGFPKDRLVIY